MPLGSAARGGARSRRPRNQRLAGPSGITRRWEWWPERQARRRDVLRCSAGRAEAISRKVRQRRSRRHQSRCPTRRLQPQNPFRNTPQRRRGGRSTSTTTTISHRRQPTTIFLFAWKRTNPRRCPRHEDRPVRYTPAEAMTSLPAHSMEGADHLFEIRPESAHHNVTRHAAGQRLVS